MQGVGQGVRPPQHRGRVRLGHHPGRAALHHHELRHRGITCGSHGRARTHALDRSVEIGIKLAGALETAHRAGVLHRDIKPENVLFSAYGEPELADFGAATIQKGSVTYSGVITVSLPYTPPEVSDGQPASEAADVYALASTLYTLLAGRPAFVRSTDEHVHALLSRILSDPAPDLRLALVEEAADAPVDTGLADAGLADAALEDTSLGRLADEPPTQAATEEAVRATPPPAAHGDDGAPQAVAPLRHPGANQSGPGGLYGSGLGTQAS